MERESSYFGDMELAQALVHYHDTIVYTWLFIGVIVFFILYFVIDAPYGRFQNSLSILPISPKLGFILFESPTLLLFPYFYWSGKRDSGTTLVLFLWLVHYIHRTIIYPLLLPTKRTKNNMSIVVVLSGVVFQLVNCYLLGMRFFGFTHHKENLHLSSDWQWWLGLSLFVVGFLFNLHSDHILRKLKKNGKASGYSIPRGGLFEYVSCGNYFAEIVEWFGFAILTHVLESYMFAFWCVVNLLPRARSSHNFYKRTFGGKYPQNRKILFPFLW